MLDPRTLHRFLRAVRLRRESVSSFEEYPFSIPAIRQLGELELDPRLTVLVGENGSGKSTLLEAIAIAAGYNAEGGTKNLRFETRASESELHRHLIPVRGAAREKGGFFLRAESLYNVATEAERRGLTAYGWDPLHELSHGEAFLWLLEHKFHPEGLYFLDEPESALSPQRQLSMLVRMHTILEGGAQLVMATHSPILMSYPGARILSLSREGIQPVELEDTEHFQVTKAFLTNRHAFLRHLLES
ncbi:MAG: AAA family ATPase [Sandaracinaceae bacterium]